MTMRLPYLSVPVRLAIFLAVTAVLADWALAAEFQRSFTFDSKEMKVANMIGQVQVKQAQGDQFRITVKVQGKDAAEELLEFRVDEGFKGELVVAFPVEDHRKYVYPALGSRGSTQVQYHNEGGEGGSWLKKVFSGLSGRNITVKGRGNGLEMWADLVIEVPRGRILEMKQAVGGIDASDLTADLNLDTHSGSITAYDITGDLLADTGSGTVEVARVKGSVNVDTGSGEVTLADLEGDKILVDTGSGDVMAANLRCLSLLVDTGSGAVEARAVETDGANIDTGSGGVLLQLDRMGTGKFIIDTGSGGITLDLPDNASAHILADTGSGGIRTQVSGANVRTQDRDELEMTLGDGEARVRLDAGSGSITIK
jgi:hypothetical protein